MAFLIVFALKTISVIFIGFLIALTPVLIMIYYAYSKTLESELSSTTDSIGLDKNKANLENRSR